MAERKVAVVTGASSGIGMETALALARRRYAVVLAARRVERLEQVAGRCEQAGAAAVVMPTDVSDAGQVEALVAGTVEKLGRVDVMVNNAGFGVLARVHETSDEQMRDLLAVNFLGVFHGCRAVAPVMIRQGGGHVFNVSSVIGKRGTPFQGAYCATKFAICGLTDALRVELAAYGVRVTCICPALTQTEFFESSPRARQGGASFARWRRIMPAAVVGRRIASAVGKRTPEIVFSPGGKLLVLLSALWPRAVDWMMKLYHDDLARRLR